MFNLPKSTKFYKRIPKGKFYENLDVSPKLKRLFIDEIKNIYWSNKISEDTVNIKRGKQVEEIQVFLISLNQKSVDEALLIQIDRQIPYHILYILQHDEEYQACVGYKEEALKGKNPFKVSTYYYTSWMNHEELKIELKGLDLDAVYENMLRDIAGQRLCDNESDSLPESIEKDQKRHQIEQEISKLIFKRNKEKQLKKQISLNDEIRVLKKKLESLN